MKKEAQIVIAGAGTGKTTHLINDLYKYFVETNLESLNQKIVCITFTSEAAKNIKQKLINKCLSDSGVFRVVDEKIKDGSLFIGTIHSFFYNLLTKQLKMEKKIILPEDVELVKSKTSYQEKPYSIDNKTFEHLVVNEHKTKNELIEYDDFDKLIIENTEKLKEFVIERLYVDEFQDSSKSQIDAIMSLQFNFIKVIGDPKQAIYEWRGSSENSINDFMLKLKSEDFIVENNTLYRSYRSDEEIIEVANLVFPEMKKLISNSGIKGIVSYLPTNNYNEAKKIIFNYAIANADKEIKVLCRKNALVNEFNEFLSGCKNVRVMTVHASKGLEAEVVFLVDWNFGEFTIGTELTDEDKRLAYVAITRAKHELYIMWNKKGRPLPFIDKSKIEEQKSKVISAERKVGDKYPHKIFGEGEIVSIQQDGVIVKFKNKERKMI